MTPQQLVEESRLSHASTTAAASSEERVRAHRGDEQVAKNACDPQRHAIRPPEAGLDRILTTTPAAIDIADREFFEHLERRADMRIGQTGDRNTKHGEATHDSGVVDALTDVQLLIGQPRK